MKTQFVQLDESDNLFSIRDKLMGVKTSRMVLVFPQKAKILDRSLDFLLLKRNAKRNGNQLAVVTTNRYTISQCKALQIPCFPSNREAQEGEWTTSPLSKLLHRSNQKTPRIIKTRQHVSGETKPLVLPMRIIIPGLVIISIILPGLVLLPSATITIHIEEINQQKSISFTAGEILESSPDAQYLPIEELTIDISDSLVIPTSGTMIFAKDFAIGNIQFENLTEDAIGIPGGSIVMSSDTPVRKYLTLEDVVVPAGVGEQVEIAARAVEAGSTSNIGIDEVSVVEGILGSMVAVRNPIPFEGGSETPVPTATKEDWDSIENALLNKIEVDCSDKINRSLAEGDVFFPDSIVITINQKENFPPETQPADFISILMDVECKAGYVTQKSILDTATRLLDDDLPPGLLPIGKPSIISASNIVKRENSYQWSIKVVRQARTQVDSGNLSLLIMGEKKDAASELIQESLSLPTKPDIKLSPRWWNTVPVVAWRISIIIDE